MAGGDVVEDLRPGADSEKDPGSNDVAGGDDVGDPWAGGDVVEDPLRGTDSKGDPGSSDVAGGDDVGDPRSTMEVGCIPIPFAEWRAISLDPRYIALGTSTMVLCHLHDHSSMNTPPQCSTGLKEQHYVLQLP